jgi:diguanylate cyclase (GGDEF)-like protein
MTQPAALTERRLSAATSAPNPPAAPAAAGDRHAAIVAPGPFFEHLQQAASHGSPSTALLVVDIDRFHAVNRAFGFVAGDRFLAEAGRRLAGCLREFDLVARLGADEFAVLLFDVFDPPSAVAVARQVLAALAAPFEVNGSAHAVSARAGAALCADIGRDVRALLHSARAALRNAKDAGLDVVVAEPAAPAAALAAWRGACGPGEGVAARELRDGLLRGEFKLHYQPIHNFGMARVDTLEALVRWRHPTRGLLGPASFLPAAERAGLAHVISVRVLDCACDSLRRWRAAGHGELRVAVNLSAQDFRRDDFAGTVVAALERHGLPPSALELELTEHEQLDDERAETQIAELASTGVGLTIDDFGVKYSSLRYLHRLPVRALKVDRSFVHDIGRSDASTSIVLALVGIARQMGLRLVAEGVEEVRQMRELRRLGCHIMQGYLFSAPVPADDVAGYLGRAARAA